MIGKIVSKFNLISGCIVILMVSGYLIFKEERRQILLERKVGMETLEDIADLLKIYTVYNDNGPIKLIHNGRDGDGGYIVPEEALTQADAVIGYGVADDISFEEQFSDKYNKESYGFDCSIKNINIKNKLTHFIPECIGTDEFLYGNAHSSNISSFNQHLQNLNLVGKKIFIKMDIEGAEFEVLPTILKDAKNITGITMELHFHKEEDRISKVLKLLSTLDKDFLLVHIYGNKNYKRFGASNVKGNIPRLLDLSYINKNLISRADIAIDQTHPSKLNTNNAGQGREEREFEVLIRAPKK